MSNLNNILHGFEIPLSALVSVIFGLMILSFPLGTYTVFNSNIGDDIDYNFPLEQFDIFVAGLNWEFHLSLEFETCSKDFGVFFLYFFS